MKFVSLFLLCWIFIAVNILNAQNQRNSSEPALTPLHIAAATGNLEEVQSLLEQGAEIEAENRYTGETPIFYAVTNQHRDTVRYLIAENANIDVQRNNGDTPLHVAARLYLSNCSLQLAEIIGILIDEGQADTTIENKKEQTYDEMTPDGSNITYARVVENNRCVNIVDRIR